VGHVAQRISEEKHRVLLFQTVEREPVGNGIKPAGAGIKNCGWGGPRSTGEQRHADALDRGRAEREEHRHGKPQKG
jgi:hypothetical protein